MSPKRKSAGKYKRDLKDPDPRVRIEAIRNLPLVVGRIPAVEFTSSMKQDPDVDVRHAVIEHLGSLSEPVTESPLLEMFRDPEAAIRKRAITALMLHESEHLEAPIREMLADEDTAVRTEAQRWLDRFHRPIRCRECDRDYRIGQIRKNTMDDEYGDSIQVELCPQGHTLSRSKIF